MARKLRPSAELHRDPLGAVDDVLVGEDVAGRVDEEAGAGAAPRRVAVRRRARTVLNGSAARPPRRSFGARAGARAVASMLTTAGLARSATSAKLTEPAPRPATAGDRVAASAAAAARTPAPRRGAGTAVGARQRTGDDDAEQEADRGGQPGRQPGTSGRVMVRSL